MVNVEIHATSHVGRVRRGNEDNYLLLNISRSKAWTSSQENGEFVIESQAFDVDDNSERYFETINQSRLSTHLNFGFNFGRVFSFR